MAEVRAFNNPVPRNFELLVTVEDNSIYNYPIPLGYTVIQRYNPFAASPRIFSFYGPRQIDETQLQNRGLDVTGGKERYYDPSSFPYRNANGDWVVSAQSPENFNKELFEKSRESIRNLAKALTQEGLFVVFVNMEDVAYPYFARKDRRGGALQTYAPDHYRWVAADSEDTSSYKERFEYVAPTAPAATPAPTGKTLYQNQTLSFDTDVRMAVFENCKVTVMRDALFCDFKTCSKVTVMRDANKCSVDQCAKVTVMRDAVGCKFTECAVISVLRDASQCQFTLCPSISVERTIQESTRDGASYQSESRRSDQGYSADVVQVSGSGNVIRGRTVQGSVVQVSPSGGSGGGGYSFGGVSFAKGVNVSRGNVVGGTQTMIGRGDKYLDNLFIPGSLGFERIEKRRDGRVYGFRNGEWYIYEPSLGDASVLSSWAKVPYMGQEMDTMKCQLCGSATDLKEKFPHPKSVDGELNSFCDKACQLRFYASLKKK